MKGFSLFVNTENKSFPPLHWHSGTKLAIPENSPLVLMHPSLALRT